MEPPEAVSFSTSVGSIQTMDNRGVGEAQHDTATLSRKPDPAFVLTGESLFDQISKQKRHHEKSERKLNSVNHVHSWFEHLF